MVFSFQPRIHESAHVFTPWTNRPFPPFLQVCINWLWSFKQTAVTNNKLAANYRELFNGVARFRRWKGNGALEKGGKGEGEGLEGEKNGMDGDDETMVYNLFLHRNRHDKCRSVDNGGSVHVKKTSIWTSADKTAQQRVTGLDFLFATINCYRSARSSPLSAKRWKRQLTITRLGLTGRWRE